MDEWGHASTAECVEWATKVAQTEGIMVGPSAGAAIKYACDIACRPEAAGKTIVVVVGSHGIRYVQHPLWAKVKPEVHSLVIITSLTHLLISHLLTHPPRPPPRCPRRRAAIRRHPSCSGTPLRSPRGKAAARCVAAALQHAGAGDLW